MNIGDSMSDHMIDMLHIPFIANDVLDFIALPMISRSEPWSPT